MTARNNAGIAGIFRAGKATSAFMVVRDNTLRDWSEMESAAWDAYQRARAPMLQQPPEGERVGEPPEVEPHALHFVMFQAAPRQADRLAARPYDIGFTHLVVKNWADWAWQKAFPNPADELSRWLAGFRKSADWKEYFRQFLAGLGRVGAQPIETSQLVTLGLVMDYFHRQTTLPYRPQLWITFGLVDGKPHLREINLRPRSREFAIDFSGLRLAGLGDLGRISMQIEAHSQPCECRDARRTAKLAKRGPKQEDKKNHPGNRSRPACTGCTATPPPMPSSPPSPPAHRQP